MFRSYSVSPLSQFSRHCNFIDEGFLSYSNHFLGSFNSIQIPQRAQQTRKLNIHSETKPSIPFGKQLKDDFKQKRIEKRLAKTQLSETQASRAATLARWDLTVGLEIHAQLNTDKKLFSTSQTSIDDPPNTNVSFFDLAFPGSQPIFQAATLIPALRAALAFNCRIENESRFDRKHYFYPDQPAGYQITQYYKPLAKDGEIVLYPYDLTEVTEDLLHIGIKQIQLEQDTAKSISHPPSTTFVDFNRVGHPLIEIITLPQIRSPQIAAACARKIQFILQSVNGVFTGMEMGGLRVDVNVSVSPKGSTKLGQRTEIKNISSFKAIEQAIAAERDRQIDILENGGLVAGETRGWSIGDTFTTKLRGKEGEVDYRYMPDPDILPLVIDESLINHLRSTLPPLPDQTIMDLYSESGLFKQDAKTLLALDGGQRLEYYDSVCTQICKNVKDGEERKRLSVMVSNWVTHELGGLLSTTARSFSPEIVPAESLASILEHLFAGQITGTSAKRLLAIVFHGDKRDIDSIIKAEGMAARHLSESEYQDMAKILMNDHPQKVAQIQKGQVGKLKFFVGQMMKIGEGNVDAVKAEDALKVMLKL